MITLIYLILIVFLSNIVQGITGFAGTLLAMPFMILLFDLTATKQVLNCLGLLASLLILIKDHPYIDYKQLKKMIGWVFIGVLIGLLSFDWLPKDVLLILFPAYLLLISIKELTLTFFNKPRKKRENRLFDVIYLVFAGIVHGLFISGGPLLVVYLTQKTPDKRIFRATLSAVWVLLNGFILVQTMVTHTMTIEIVRLSGISLLPLIIGTLVGQRIGDKMNQKIFLILSYLLLIISAVSMLL